ncbi:helix-turn-helix domain-containing protein [Streptomyces sp. AA1529]|uniref:helix-turn-helix domain-containing protein n=1 Tax=Streptomyces sp. AA1529 TaxID=1203257 RepID=UPI003D748723
MPGPKDIDGSAGVPTFYGKELRWKREQAGLTQPQLVEGSFYGHSHLSEIERGERRMPPDLAAHVDKVLKTDGFFSRRCEDVRNARRRGHAPYFERVLETEGSALSIDQWSPTLVPGLLQTEAYMRAVIRSTHPQDLPEEVDGKVRARQARAELFENPKTPEYWVIMHEVVLREPLLEPEEMALQLDHVSGLAKRRRIVPQVLQWNAATRALMTVTLTSLEFADAPPLVYAEGPYHGHAMEDPGSVRQYQKAYDRLRAAALSPDASLALIEAAAEDYRSGRRPVWLERSLAQE